MARPVLYVRDGGTGVVEEVATLARAVRARYPGRRVSDADVARQLILAGLRCRRIVRDLGVNNRGRRSEQASASSR